MASNKPLSLCGPQFPTRNEDAALNDRLLHGLLQAKATVPGGEGLSSARIAGKSQGTELGRNGNWPLQCDPGRWARRGPTLTADGRPGHRKGQQAGPRTGQQSHVGTPWAGTSCTRQPGVAGSQWPLHSPGSRHPPHGPWSVLALRGCLGGGLPAGHFHRNLWPALPRGLAPDACLLGAPFQLELCREKNLFLSKPGAARRPPTGGWAPSRSGPVQPGPPCQLWPPSDPCASLGWQKWPRPLEQSWSLSI